MYWKIITEIKFSQKQQGNILRWVQSSILDLRTVNSVIIILNQ